MTEVGKELEDVKKEEEKKTLEAIREANKAFQKEIGQAAKENRTSSGSSASGTSIELNEKSYKEVKDQLDYIYDMGEHAAHHPSYSSWDARLKVLNTKRNEFNKLVEENNINLNEHPEVRAIGTKLFKLIEETEKKVNEAK